MLKMFKLIGYIVYNFIAFMISFNGVGILTSKMRQIDSINNNNIMQLLQPAQ